MNSNKSKIESERLLFNYFASCRFLAKNKNLQEDNVNTSHDAFDFSPCYHDFFNSNYSHFESSS